MTWKSRIQTDFLLVFSTFAHYFRFLAGTDAVFAMGLMSSFKSESSLAGSLPGFSDWQRYLEETVSECLPPKLRRLLGRGGGRMELRLHAQHAEAALIKGGETAGTDQVDAGDDLGLKEILRRAEKAQTDLHLVAPESQVLRRVVFMPAQVRQNLSKVLQYELERLTPFQADQVFFDFRQLPTEAPNQIKLDLAVLRRDRIEPWLAALARLNGRTKSLLWPGAWPGANLLPAALRQGRKPGSRIVGWALWALTLLLLGAVLATPLLQKHRLAADLEHQVQTTRNKLQQVDVLRERLRQASDSATQVLDLKSNAVYTIEFLRKLTDLLPDHTWVEQWNLDKRKINFRGESKQATALIEVLSTNPEFRNVSFMSPVVGIKNTDRERFHISLELARPEPDDER